MPDAWGYVRLSQTGRDGTIDGQKETIREYVRDRDDLQLVTTLNDGTGTSGFDCDREKYTLLKEKIRDGSVDAVVVRDRDRLARDFDERLRLLLLFREADVEYHAVEEGGRIGLEDETTAGLEAIKAAMSHESKKAEIVRSKEVTEDRIESGYDHGRPRFGMTYDEEGQYQVPGEDFDQVREIFLRRDRGETYAEISEGVGVAESTVQNVVDRREWYEKRSEIKLTEA